MILSKEFYNRCCPTYKKLIDGLEKELADLNDRGAMRAAIAILKFSRSYLTPKEYWNLCFEYTGDLDFGFHRSICREIAGQAYFHLQYDHLFYLSCYYRVLGKNSKLIDYCGSELDERDIQYPHSDLDICFRKVEKTTYQLPSKKLINRYEAMKTLYSEIKAAEEDVNEWFNLLLEVRDNEFVRDNVEYRLGNNYFDVQLWKLYFGFLKEHGEYKQLLLLYSKYCRFFLDDKEMLDEYKKDMIRYGPVCLPWKKLFDFEVNIEETEEEEGPKLEAVLPLDKNLCSTFYNTFKAQIFALPKPLVLYIRRNANHRVLRKLFSSCKYFFAKQSTPICYRLDGGCDESAVFYGEKLSISNGENPDLFMNNTYVTGSIEISGRPGIYDNDYISTLVPRMYRCEAKFVNLWLQKLSFDELKFLIKHGGVVELNLFTCRILDENNELIDLEEVMKYLPNIESLLLGDTKVNANTGHALSKLKFNAKLSWFTIDTIFGEPFDAREFLNFCTANGDGLLDVEMVFDKKFNADFVAHFSKFMYDYVKSSENTEIVDVEIRYL